MGPEAEGVGPVDLPVLTGFLTEVVVEMELQSHVCQQSDSGWGPRRR